MLAFNLNKEVFTSDIQLPCKNCNSRITDLNDCIACIYAKESESNNKIYMCKLDDEACLRYGGGKASWALMLNINVNFMFKYVYGYFNNGDLMLDTNDGHRSLLLYNPHKNETRNVQFLIGFGRIIFKYNESLVSITSRQVNYNADEDDIQKATHILV
ncbi:hypothetical protein POM88_028568 [Heracleum sosnowskyi]|uniref:Uncharacterized protein n=1 Tax=Heracleum sosnowskyi TaxID=360622 RepID=A0AAD8ME57_9APIA|nr:hypothetical protein POM88_028568 [Heracleum sosnowskyi]